MTNTFATAFSIACLLAVFVASTSGQESTDAPPTATTQSVVSQAKSSLTERGKGSRSSMPVVKVLRTDPISSTVDGKAMSASLIEVAFAPKVSSPPHYHPGEVVGYVAEGTLEFKIAGKPLRTLTAGDTFFEPTMILHEVARNPDAKKPCRIIVTMIHPRDATRLTIPAKGRSAAAALGARPPVANSTPATH